MVESHDGLLKDVLLLTHVLGVMSRDTDGSMPRHFVSSFVYPMVA